MIGKLIITGEIECLTGIRIGGEAQGFKIGGLDNPVIRDANEVPYIPGSSFKGKMRSLIEWKKFAEINDKSKIDRSKWFSKLSKDKYDKEKYDDKQSHHVCYKDDCEVCRVFGTTEGTFGPTRLIVRDSTLIKQSLMNLRGIDQEKFTEEKMENVINRIEGKAEHPRHMERVPTGAKFNFELVYTLYDKDDGNFIGIPFTAMQILQDDTLGGSGSRGYGKVRFVNIGCKYRPIEYYVDEKYEINIFNGIKKSLEEIKIKDILDKIKIL